MADAGRAPGARRRRRAADRGARRRGPGRHRPRRPSSGFTLIELVTAFGILALATAVAVPAFLQLVREDDMTAATRKVERLFRLARDSAIHGGRPVTVVIDSVSGLVWLDVPPALGEREWETAERERSPFEVSRPGVSGPGAGMLPRPDNGGLGVGTSLELPRGIRLELPAARTRFTFAPSGQAFGEHLVLAGSAGARQVTLDQWTGDVVVR